jgi:hypothetical protein
MNLIQILMMILMQKRSLDFLVSLQKKGMSSVGKFST